jgi:hypothetical protein
MEMGIYLQRGPIGEPRRELIHWDVARPMKVGSRDEMSPSDGAL